MQYVKHILLPGEQILYDGHVHPKVLIPGMVILGVAAWVLHISSNTGHWHSMLLSFAFYLSERMAWTSGFYHMLEHWQQTSPDTAPEIKVLATVIALVGFAKLMQGVVLMQSFEL